MARWNGRGFALRAGWMGVIASLLIAVTARSGRAQALDRDDVPRDLAPWIGWALDDAGDDACTLVDATRTCVWPGRLALDASPTAVRFVLDVVVERRSSVTLPGSVDLWPEDVKSGGEEAIVTEGNGAPQIWLSAGVHHVEGRIPFAARPAVLPLPAAMGKVSLKLDGESVATRWESEGKLWLTSERTSMSPEDPAAKEQERLDLEVFRRIEDGVPLVVTTLLDLRVAGAPREVHLGKPVLAGGVLLSVTANGLPIRMESDGDMVVGVVAGKHRVELRERHATPPEGLKLEARPAPWPADEIWALQPRLDQRQVEPAGMPPVDPSRTNAPAEWNTLQMWKAHAPGTLVLKTTRRGNPEPPPNKLKLSRDIWLDATGSGYTVVDLVEGTMSRDFRLDFAGPGDLGNVALRNERDQLISVSGDRSLPGVEIRNGGVSFTAEWRSREPLTAIPAIGWSTDVESLRTVVHLAPGWELAHASGGDDVWGQWGDDWEVIDLAILAGIALAAGRVFGRKWGVLAAAAVGAAQSTDTGLRWWILAAIATTAIAGLSRKTGRLAGLARFGTRAAALGVAWLALHFAARQTRVALWPATETADVLEREMEGKQAEVEMASADNKEGGTGTRAKGEEGSMGAPLTRATSTRYGVRGPADDGLVTAAERSADEIVQTGHGIPRWELGAAAVQFTGAVDRGRTIRFYLLSPWQSATVALLRVALVLAFAWHLVREAFRPGGPRARARGAPYRAAAVAAAALALLAAPSSARAETPSAEVLAELKARLTRPPACAPRCADVSSMKVDAGATSIKVTVSAHAEAPSAIVLPGSADGWNPTRIDVDGKRAVALRTQGGALLLRLSRGTHEVELEGPVTSTGFSMSLGTRPHRVRTKLAGWTIEGVEDGGAPSGDALVFHKTGVVEPDDGPANAPSAEAPPTAVAIPPWLEVSRVLDLGVTWTVTTIVRRVSPTGPALVVRIPLVEGEKVVEGGAHMEGGKVSIDLGRDAKEAKLVSALTPRDTVLLEASLTEPWSETWVVRCSAIWQCRSEGVPPIENRAEGTLQATFQPWPGEKLTLHLVKPPAAKGMSTTIDQAVLRLTPGETTTEASLAIDMRTSTGGTQIIALPDGARVEEVLVNGRGQPSPDAASLRIPLAPGPSSIRIGFKLNAGRGLLYRAPAIDLGAEATNARVEIANAHDRTVLWAGGGAWGPVVLVWPLMLLLGAIGLAASRLPGSPLTPRQWLVLAPGLTQAPAIVGAIVVAWIFAVHHRRDRDRASRLGDGATQVGIVALTFAAFMSLAACVYVGVTRPRNLLETDVWRSGNGEASSSSHLTWYFDRTAAGLPRPWVVSTPLWVWKIAMVAWAVAVTLAIWPFVRSAAARFLAGGIFHKPTHLAGAPNVSAPAANESRRSPEEPAGPEGETPATGNSPADGNPT